MGVGCKPIGKFEGIMRKMENERVKMMEANKAKEKPKKKRS